MFVFIISVFHQRHWLEQSMTARGNELPVTAFTSFVMDYLGESRREQRLGKGVHMGTVHSAKGMEYRVVLLLTTPGWRLGSTTPK